MSDTVKDLRLSRKLVYRQGARDMRERAAKLVDTMEIDWTSKTGSIRRQIIRAIEALPIDPETGGADGQ